MTDRVFWAALMQCFFCGCGNDQKRCSARCPLIGEPNCLGKLKWEVRRRNILSRQEEHRNGRQLTIEDIAGGENGGSENRLPGAGRIDAV